MAGKLIRSTLKKILLLMAFVAVSNFFSCEANDPEVYNYRRQLIVETNLPSIRIDNYYLDSTTVYPFILYDFVDAGGPGGYITIYPSSDTGEVNLLLYGGKSFDQNPSLSFKDSLSVKTPIDTTVIGIVEFDLIKY